MKKFYEKKIDKQCKEQVRYFLKTFGVRVRFVKKGWCSAIVGENLIEIDLRETYTVQKMWSCVLHELGHIYCYQNNLYEIYHKENISPKKFAKYIRRYGLRAERYVDKVGERLMKDYFPDIPFIGCYSSEDSVKWYRKWVKRNYPL